MKKVLVLFLSVLLIFGCFGMPVEAQQPVCIFVDGRQVDFEVQPVIVENRAMVPMRAIFEQLGASIVWDPNTATVTATSPEGRVLVLQVGNTRILVNGKESMLEAVPFIMDNRTLVPARAVSEGLMADVSWEASSSTAIITSLKQQEKQMYRQTLPDLQQQFYDIIYVNCLRGIQEFSLPAGLSTEQLTNTFWCMFYDCPEFFWLESEFSYRYDSTGMVKSITIKGNSVEKWDSQFYSRADHVLDIAKTLPSDVEKVRYIHDYLAETVEYDLNAPNHQSAYSAIVAQKTVCAGYARAFEYFMQELGIPCTYVVGTLYGGSHAWNLVQLNGAYFNVDVTSDDLGPFANYQYFLVSDASMQASHQRTDISKNLPVSLADF